MKQNQQKNRECIICGGESDFFLNGLFDDRYSAPGRYSIYKCAKCGFGKIHPQLKRKEISNFYAKYYPLIFESPNPVKKAAKLPNKFLSWLNGTNNIAHYYISGGTKVLDVGSASGISLLEIEKLGSKAYGIEPDPSAQKIAKKLKLNVYQGFITDNPFPGKKFDYITASQVIEHDPGPRDFLKAVYNNLGNDGKVIMSFPNVDSLYRILFGRRWINWHVPFHCNFFTKRAFIKLVNSAGFRVQKIITVTPNDWTIVQLAMLLGKSHEGKPGLVWSMVNESKIKPRSVIFKLIKKIIIFFALIPITLINRFIDYFGYGESFLVIMEKKK